MKTITVVDYGRSNLLSVQRALEHCGAAVEFATTPGQVLAATALVLPGVGAFADGMRMLGERGLIEPVVQKANSGTPLMGICLGMQFLFDQSMEGGENPGLGLVPGKVEKLPQLTTDGKRLVVPHVGWGALKPGGGRANFGGTLLENTQGEVYFVHSYRAMPANPAHCLAQTIYGGHRVCAAVQKQNIWGMQFHPEKSAEAGLSILKQFIDAV